MTHTQLRAYPYKREAIRTTLLSLLSDEHIRTVSPTTRRLVERNLKADWCVALSPRPPETVKEVQEEARVEQKLSKLALEEGQASACGKLRKEELSPSSPASTIGSTLSVNAVADAEQPQRDNSHRHVRHAKSQDLRRYVSRGSVDSYDDNASQRLSSSLDTLPLPSMADSTTSSTSVTTKKSKIPPPRPPKSKSAKGSLSVPNTPPESSLDETPPPSREGNISTAGSGGGFITRFRRAPPPTPERKRNPPPPPPLSATQHSSHLQTELRPDH